MSRIIPPLLGSAVGGGGSGYVAKAVFFDVTNPNQFSDCASLSCIDNGVIFQAFWIKGVNAGSDGQMFQEDPNGAFSGRSLIDFPTGTFSVTLEDGNGNSELFAATDANVVPPGAYHHILWAAKVDLAAGSKQIALRVDGVPVPFTTINDTDPSFTLAYNTKEIVCFGNGSGPSVDGSVSDYWLAPGINILNGGGGIPDATALLFYNAGPVNPATAIAVVGLPAILFSGDQTTFPVNQGPGGSFSLPDPLPPTVAGPP